MSTNVYADMSKAGLGIWFCIHTMAVNAKTPETKRAYADFVRLICQSLRCNTCHGHCSMYLQNVGNVDNFINRKVEGHEDEELGCAYHSWSFHNAANVHAGKAAHTDFYGWYQSFVGAKGCSECGVNARASTHNAKATTSNERAKTRMMFFGLGH